MDPRLLSQPPTPRRPWQRPRRCLLKGCEHWFRPSHPACRYCSPQCRTAADRWRRWRAQQRYRAHAHGRRHRRQQAQRYRQRRAARVTTASPAAATPPPTPDNVAPQPPPKATEGKRHPKNPNDVVLRPCDRPGCYVLLAVASPWQTRRFCCVLCQRALRCLLQREARFRRRRRRGLRRPGRRPRPPPRRPQ